MIAVPHGRRWWIAPVALGSVFACHLLAQTPEDAASIQLHGTVIDGKTGKPIARALVTTGDRRLATMTGNDGHFTMGIEPAGTPANGVTAGVLRSMSLGLTALKPGYLGNGPEAQVFLGEAASEDVVLKLMPAVSISGHITAPDTDAPRNVPVRLLRVEPGVSGSVWVQYDQERTDSHGEFRFGGLEPGEYTVVTAEWRDGVEGQPSVSEVTSAFPPTYNGDASNLEAAALLHLHYGDAARVEMHLHLETFYPVTVRVAPSGANSGVDTHFVGADAFSSYELPYDAGFGALKGALPSGTYNLLLQGQGQQPETFAALALHVERAPLVVGPVTLVPSGQIPVHVHKEFTGQKTQAQQVIAWLSFLPVATGAPNPRSGDASKPDYEVSGAAPGRYNVFAQVPYGYLASMTSGGVDLTRDSLTVGPGGAAPIEIVLRDDTATITGTVTHAEGPLPRHVWIVAMGTSTRQPLQTRIVEAQRDGTYTLTNVPPGTYYVLASANLPAARVLYGDPEVANRLQQRVPATAAGAGQTVQVETPLLDAADLEAP